MQIKNLKINQYGNIENKELDFKKFNIVYGKNESGKSTLLNFILSSFYGISKNKNGKFESDYDRYNPWNQNEFSGNINYSLDDNSEYSVFRNFDKKNPQILDEMGNDISKSFEVDKKNGIQFLSEQINVEREMMESTVISEQKEVELDVGTQNQLLQKIANLAESGDEEISYKQAASKLDKLLLNEVGTDRSSDRPINNTKLNIYELNKNINSIKMLEDERNQIESKKQKVIEQIKEEQNNKIIYDKIKKALDFDNMESERISVKKNIIEENSKKIAQKEDAKKELNKKKNTKLNMTILIILILVNIILGILLKNVAVSGVLAVLLIAFIGFTIIKNKKNSDSYLTEQILILKKNNVELNKEVGELEENLNKRNNLAKEELSREYGNNIVELFNSGINEIIENNIEAVNDYKLEFHKLELDGKNIEEKFEKLAKYKEELAIEEEKLEELNKKAEIFSLTKEILQNAYQDMKNSITPKFNIELSKNIEKFSNGKYKNINITDGLFVVLENGESVPIEKLSTGTIEQIYLALRLSVINEISKEKLPIILDEAFAYYDDERLAETLKFLNKIDNQVIILSCTNREKKILENEGIEFNYLTI